MGLLMYSTMMLEYVDVFIIHSLIMHARSHGRPGRKGETARALVCFLLYACHLTVEQPTVGVHVSMFVVSGGACVDVCSERSTKGPMRFYPRPSGAPSKKKPGTEFSFLINERTKERSQ